MTLSREQNTKDLKTLLADLAQRASNSNIDSAIEDLTDIELADLVDKTAYVIEWMGWS